MKRLVLALLLVGSATMALAQMGEVSLSFGKSIMRNNSLGSTIDALGDAVNAPLDANFHLALRMTVNNSRFFGHEFGYAYNRSSLQIGSSSVGMPIHQGFYDFLLYATKEGTKVRPFAAGGAGFSSFFPPGSSVFSGNGVTKFGFNYGAGIKVRVSDSFLIRLDARDYATGKPDFGLSPQGWLHQLSVSAGLGFTF
jgi:opacity protein-like surface antigen